MPAVKLFVSYRKGQENASCRVAARASPRALLRRVFQDDFYTHTAVLNKE